VPSVAIANLVMQSAVDAGVDPRLALEVAIQESNLNPNALSPAGAIGVMQLEPDTAAALGVDPTDVGQNIQGGVTYLKQQLNRFGDVALALAAYNWGPEAVAKALSAWGAGWLAHAPAETQNYVATILSRLQTAYSVSVEPRAVARAAFQQLVSQASQLEASDWGKIALMLGVGVGLYLVVDALT